MPSSIGQKSTGPCGRTSVARRTNAIKKGWSAVEMSRRASLAEERQWQLVTFLAAAAFRSPTFARAK